MFCSNCGSEVKEGQAICLSCGFALKNNTVNSAAGEASEIDLSDRVSHDLLRLWPDFNEGPVGRIEFLKKNLFLIGMAFLYGFAIAAVTNAPQVLQFVVLLGALAGCLILLAHQVALLYKRFWDMGVQEVGTRWGMVIGYFVVAAIPVLGIAILAVWFWPPKR